MNEKRVEITDRCSLHLGDCLDVLPSIGPIDACVCDPPYALTANKKGGSGAASVNLESPYGRARVTTGNGAGGFMGKKWDSAIPGPEYWQAILGACKPGVHLLAFGGTRTFHRLACAIEDAGWEIRDTLMWVYGSGFPKSHNLDGEHDGWGTALKPAWEPIIMARKPLEGTVAYNVQEHGCGALNIDGCRIDGTVTTNPLVRNVGGFGSNGLANQSDPPTSVISQGRWPANLIHDGSEEVVALFPADAGASARVNGDEPSANHKSCYGERERVPGTFFADSGSAARFFYCAKACQEDRDDGCESLGAAKQDPSRKEGNPGGDNPRNRGVHERRNFHPTVKPTALMRYLCRLVTPKGGLILDPFMGSGSTGKAAMLEGFRFVGIDAEPDYVKIAEARIRRALQQTTLAL